MNPLPVQLCWRCNGPIYSGEPVKYYFEPQVETWIFCHYFRSVCEEVAEIEERFLKEVGVSV